MQTRIDSFVDSFVTSILTALAVVAVCVFVGFGFGKLVGVMRDKVEGTPGKYEHEYATRGSDVGLQIGSVVSEIVRPRPRMGGARVSARVSPHAPMLRARPHVTERKSEQSPLEEEVESLLQSYVIDQAQGISAVQFRSERFGVADGQVGEITRVACPAAWHYYENISVFEAFKSPDFREAYKRAIAQIPREVWEINKNWLTLTNVTSAPSACIQTQLGIFVFVEASRRYSVETLAIIFDPNAGNLVVHVFDGAIHRVIGSPTRSLRTIASSKALMQWQTSG